MDFAIEGSARPRPAAERILYCDGSGANAGLRDGIDVDLSHWIPNRTPTRYRADTSTAICMSFVAAGGARPEGDLALNNHADVDGFLSVFTLVEGEAALAHRDVIVSAAEMGDFAAWGEHPAQVLYQSLALLRESLLAAHADPFDIYARAFERARAVLAGAPAPETEEGLAALAESARLLEEGAVERKPWHARFVHYVLPRALAERDRARALAVPPFDRPLGPGPLVWPHARNRLDGERVQLVSVETDDGWFHDLWYPGYLWADTPSRWTPPGLVREDSNGSRLDHPPLARALAQLQEREAAPGRWRAATRLSPFQALEGRGFPVVAAFLEAGAAAPSALPGETVAAILAPAFA